MTSFINKENKVTFVAMKHLKHCLTIILTILASMVTANARPSSPSEANLRLPLDIPVELSANFGELRPNHFHAGLDFKTQQRTGLKIHSVADGYISSILVSPWGYGKAIFVTHPSIGITTVYGHLEAFAPHLAERVAHKQHSTESFSVTLEFGADEFPLKKGDIIGYSGNSGSSGGPHLHMETRDAVTGDAIDPMPYYKQYIPDNDSPVVHNIYLYSNGGAIIGEGTKASRKPQSADNEPFKAWGDVFAGITAFDKMTRMPNIYGVKHLTLLVDGKRVYSHNIDRYPLDSTRAINTTVDYGKWLDSRTWVMWTKIPESNPLGSMIKTENNGIITINEERAYNCQFILEDEHGNRTAQNFTIIGERTSITTPPAPKGTKITYDTPFSGNIGQLALTIPANALYENTHVNVSSTPSTDYFSNLFNIGDPETPLAKPYQVEIPLTNDFHNNKRQYCLVRLNGTHKSAVGGKYQNGKIIAKLNRFGRYAVTTDTEPPTITHVNTTATTLTFKISDSLSGIESFSGKIDGTWIVMELDGKTSTLTGKIDRTLFPPTKKYPFSLTVTDDCGNKKIFTEMI